MGLVEQALEPHLKLPWKGRLSVGRFVTGQVEAKADAVGGSYQR